MKLVKVVELLPRGCIAVADGFTMFEDGRVLLFIAVCGENGRHARYVATFDGRRVYVYLYADGEKVEGGSGACGRG